jgi:hypothetical protein
VRRFLLRGQTASNAPLTIRNFDGSRSRKIRNRKNGVRNYLHGFVTQSFSSLGFYSNAFISYSSFNAMKFLGNSNPDSYRTLKEDFNLSEDVAKNSTAGKNKTRVYDFEFAYDVGILALSEDILKEHKFEIVNVTLSGIAR